MRYMELLNFVAMRVRLHSLTMLINSIGAHVQWIAFVETIYSRELLQRGISTGYDYFCLPEDLENPLIF